MSSKQPPGTVGVIGIGVMGSRVAEALAEAGLNVIGHDTLYQIAARTAG
jgi:phosphoglycerate dehydrogenase-like enzyme